jgi:hypothetical protein
MTPKPSCAASRRIGFITTVSYNNPQWARREGVLRATGDLVCCIDADDFLDPHYLANGMKPFLLDYRVGVVYSDVAYFGLMQGQSAYPEHLLETDVTASNLIHSGALFRRTAAILTRAFEPVSSPGPYYEDWHTWRKLLSAGYWAVKQPALYHYNRHGNSRSNRQRWNQPTSYFDNALLSQERISLCVLFSGHPKLMNSALRFLDTQQWPPHQVSLMLVNTSPAPDIAQHLKAWLRDCRYRDTMYLACPNDTAPAADSDCHYGDPDTLYRLIGSAVDSAYVWLVPDCVVPPLNGAEVLLRGFNSHCQRVTLLPQSAHPSAEPPKDLPIDCSMVRARALQAMLVSDPPEAVTLPKGIVLKNAHVRPLAPSSAQDVLGRPVTADTFDEEFYAFHNPDITEAVARGDFPSGFEHYLRFGEMEGRLALRTFSQFDEADYLERYPDVAAAVQQGTLPSGSAHYKRYGFQEGRLATFE